MADYTQLLDEIAVYKTKVDELTASGTLDANSLLLLAESLYVTSSMLGISDIAQATAAQITRIQNAGTATVAVVNGTANGTAVSNLQSSYNTLNTAYTNLTPRVTSLESTVASQNSTIATASALAGLGGWNAWAVVTANKTLIAKDRVFVVPAAGLVITLPASPALGDAVEIWDVAGTSATTNFTVARNGSLIMGQAQDLTFNVNSRAIRMVYSNATYGWRIK